MKIDSISPAVKRIIVNETRDLHIDCLAKSLQDIPQKYVNKILLQYSQVYDRKLNG
jgi:hypothetical protein